MNSFEAQLQGLVRFLSAQKIRYVILGGVAVSMYGEPRLTADIDVTIILDKQKITTFLKHAQKYGFFPALPGIKGIAKESGVIPMSFKKGKTTGKFDFIIAENALEYAAIERGRMKKIGTLAVRMISPEDLIIHKIASSRPRDIEDLNGILIRQQGGLDMEYIRRWLAKIDKVDERAGTQKVFKGLLKQLSW